MQTKRELFFKTENGGLTTSPSVPPPQPPTTGVTIQNSSAPTSAPPAAPAKPRLPPTSVTLNSTDSSEDSNKRETAKNENNKDLNMQVYPRPTPPTKPKELDGYVGFANLPNQVYRKAVKKGFDFTLMVVGL